MQKKPTPLSRKTPIPASGKKTHAVPRKTPGLDIRATNIPYKCDRTDQEGWLQGQINHWRAFGSSPAAKRETNRPFVCIVHGNSDECHEVFLDRLIEKLPKMLGGKSPVRDFLVALPERVYPVGAAFDFLRLYLCNALSVPEYSQDMIVKTISKEKTPVLFHSYLDSEGWEMDGKNIVRAFLKFWNSFPDLPEDNYVMSCLFFKYRKLNDPSNRNLSAANEEARAFFNELAVKLGSPLEDSSELNNLFGVVLPELSPIRQTDVEVWIKEKGFFEGICKRHTPKFCEIPAAITEINEIYGRFYRENQQRRIPMEPLAKELFILLDKYRCKRREEETDGR